ncbi:MAG: SDR family oxidoreductase [Balneolaceae bacterium]|nr:SDR family oxidoreductase [Balneolaceae bacterium]
MTHVLLAGATGYLGKHILKELESWRIPTTALARNPNKLHAFAWNELKVAKAEVTDPESLAGLFEGVSTVISTIGITRQRDGLTYMDVDYQANMNLLAEASRAGVKKFIYVSAIGGERHRHLQIFKAKERFVDVLKQSGLEYTIVRPNGFFSDLNEILFMAKRGRVYMFGDGEYKLNPIHGSDLAEVIVQAIAQSVKEIEVGGPDVLTQNEIAEMALSAWNHTPRITHLPDWIRTFALKVSRRVLDEKIFGPIEFFLTLIATDAVAPRYGSRRLQEYYKQEVKNHLNH